MVIPGGGKGLHRRAAEDRKDTQRRRFNAEERRTGGRRGELQSRANSSPRFLGSLRGSALNRLCFQQRVPILFLRSRGGRRGTQRRRFNPQARRDFDAEAREGG